jgi:deoxyribose-phosphate aldolase
MHLTGSGIARMIDLSTVRAEDSDDTIRRLVETACKYRCHLITTLPCQTRLARELLGDESGILIGGNVGFPSGGQTTLIKVAETKELLQAGCREIDMVINLAKLLSGRYDLVLDDIRAVVEAAGDALVKVILECHYLTDDLIRKGCDLCIQAGAEFVKTGTGWAPTGATLENIALIHTHVGDTIRIKASGGIRDVNTLLEMYRRGACRFGIGLRWVETILAEAAPLNGIEVS